MQKDERITIRLDESLLRRLRTKATKADRSLSDIIRRILSKEMETK